MRFIRMVVLLAVLIGAATGAAQRDVRADIVITHVSVVDTQGGATQTSTIVIRGGTIDRMLPPDAPAPDAAVSIDGRGKFLIPGLWDMHVHLATNPSPLLAEHTMLPLFLAHGIVGVRDMGGPLERVLALRDQVKKGTLRGPRIITPGPFIDGAGDPDPMFTRATSADEARRRVRELAKAGVDFLKVQASLTREPYDAVIQEARSLKLPVAGHVPVFLSVSHVVESGQRSIEHISPALVGDAGLLFACSRREEELRAELMAIERERAKTPADQIRARETRLRAELIDTFDPEKAASLGRTLQKHQSWVVPTLVWSNSFRPLHQSDTGADLPLDFLPAAMRETPRRRPGAVPAVGERGCAQYGRFNGQGSRARGRCAARRRCANSQWHGHLRRLRPPGRQPAPGVSASRGCRARATRGPPIRHSQCRDVP